MEKKSTSRWLLLNAILIFTIVPTILLSFQNCAPKSFSTASDEGSSGNPGPGSGPGSVTGSNSGNHDLILKDQLIRTEFNTPKTFLVETTGNRAGFTYSFDATMNLALKDIANVGRVEVTNASTWEVKFTPVFGFRGEVQMWVFARHTDGSINQAKLTLQVGNAVNLLAPALAIRGSGCITCHAEVHSNVITDFGYGGDGGGRNYYFGTNPPATFAWNDGMAYGDQNAFFDYGNGVIGDGSWYNLHLVKKSDGSGQKVYVPAASLPSGPAGATSASTLRGYVQHRLTNSFYADSHVAAVVEKSSVYIGAPTASRLQTVFNWSGSDETVKYKFIADAGAQALSGLNFGASGPSNGSYFTNTGTLVCEGDLLLKGTVYFNNLSVKTRTGCRLYVTGSVFIYGPITYVTASGDYSKRNLQISSAKAILMGLGSLWNTSGEHCEEGGSDSGYWGYYRDRAYWTQGMTQAEKSNYETAIADSAKFRLDYFWGLPGFYFRSDARLGATVTKEIYNELISKVGAQQDASCRPEGQGVLYERLLLNAPLVESRYTGGFKGSIIAEIGLMGLGLNQGQPRFKFEFDPVFQNVDVLPLLKEQDFLRVQ